MAVCASSCGGAGESDLFGDVPRLYEEYLHKKDGVIERAHVCMEEQELTQLYEECEELHGVYFEKIKDAAESWSGTKLALRSNDTFEIKSALKVHYDDFFNKTDLTVQYTLTGEVVVARDIFPETDPELLEFYRRHPERLKGMDSTLELVGLDANDRVVVSTRIGHISKVLEGNSIGIKAGTPVVFERLRFKDYAAADYKRIRSLALSLN